VSVTCDPASGSTFPIGETTVDCSATDQAGNQATGSFKVTIKGATDQITDLQNEVTNLGLPKGLTTSLQAKLNDALTAAKANDTATACTKLDDFINQVNAQSGKKIDKNDADNLIANAKHIQAVLGCT
jgi:hypothetical protein